MSNDDLPPVEASAGPQALRLRYSKYLTRWLSARLPQGTPAVERIACEVLDAAFRDRKDQTFLTEAAFLLYLRGQVRGSLPDCGGSPVEDAIGPEALQRYEEALSRLDEKDRQAIVACLEMHLDDEEFAEALGDTSEHNVKTVFAQALLRLAEEMANADG